MRKANQDLFGSKQPNGQAAMKCFECNISFEHKDDYVRHLINKHGVLKNQ